MTVKGVVDGRAELGLVRLEEQIAAAITGARASRCALLRSARPRRWDCRSFVSHRSSPVTKAEGAHLRFTLRLQADVMMRLLPAEVPSPSVLRLAPDAAAKIHLPILCQHFNTTLTALSAAAQAVSPRVNGVRIA